MWIGADGAVNVAVIWDDPWSILDPRVEQELREASSEELERIEAWLWPMSAELMLHAREYFSQSPRDVEAQFDGREIARESIIFRGPPDVELSVALRNGVANVELRWRIDAVQALIEALGQIAFE